MADLYPTKTRVALLREVAAGAVVHCPAGDGWAAEDQHRPPLGPIRRVTGRMTEMEQAGWVRKGSPEFPSIYARRPWQLTDAGRAVLAASGGEA